MSNTSTDTRKTRLSRRYLSTLCFFFVMAMASCAPQNTTESTTSVEEQNVSVSADIDAMDSQGSEQQAAEEPPTDLQIALAVRNELFYSDSVSVDDLSVASDRGVVTLDGEVDNVLAKESAVRRAEMVRGVRAVIDQLTVRRIDIDDQVLNEHVSDALLFDPSIDSTTITANVSDGVVELTGRVPSWQQNRLVEHVVAGVRGVRSVENELTVISLEPRTDAEIENDVMARFRTDRWLDEELLTVSLDGGNVTVSGTVGSVATRRRAYERAWVPGVQGVNVDDVEIESWAAVPMRREPDVDPDLSDQEVAAAVRDAFLYDPRVYSFEPTIVADDGVVTLMGSVSSVAARAAATETALNTIGVYRVRNQLHVNPVDELTETELEPRVRNVLAWNPYVDRHEITVDAVGSRIYLYGDVDSSFERAEAERVASSVSGVSAVTNMIRVRDDDSAPPLDWMLRQEVESQLYWNPWVDSTSIDVSVQGGVVTLSGALDDWRAYVSAVDDAYQCGAERVVTNVTIRESTPSYFVP
jgi:osmotically-inducible protein OsmY